MFTIACLEVVIISWEGGISVLNVIANRGTNCTQNWDSCENLIKL